MSLVFPIGTAPRLPNSQQHVTCPCRVDSSAVLGADIGARQAHAKPSQPGETVPRIFEWWMVSGIFKVAFLDQPMPTTELAWAACGHEIIWVTASATSKRDHMINRGRECRECEVVTASIIRPGRRWQGPYEGLPRLHHYDAATAKAAVVRVAGQHISDDSNERHAPAAGTGRDGGVFGVLRPMMNKRVYLAGDAAVFVKTAEIRFPDQVRRLREVVSK